MDREVPKGCEQPPETGHSEGQSGGSVAPGGGSTPDVKAAFVPKLNEAVYLRWKGQWLRVIVTNIFDFNNAIEVANSTGPFTVTRADVISVAEYKEKIWSKAVTEAHQRYHRLLEIWPRVPVFDKKAKRNKWIGDELGEEPRTIAAQIRACQHFDLIVINEEQSPANQSDIGGS